MQTARAALPSDLPAPAVRTFDPAQATVVTLSVTSNSLSSPTCPRIVTDKIVPALEQIHGISNVNAGGTVTPAIEVTVDPNKLSAAGYTLNDIVNSIQANNVRAPGGIAYLPHRETSIDVRGDIQTPQSVAQLLLSGSSALPGARDLAVGHVADALHRHDQHDQPGALARQRRRSRTRSTRRSMRSPSRRGSRASATSRR